MASSVDFVYETIKNQIINFELVPGSKIREEDLAKKFNISRTPIRSVIARLVKDSLLIVVPQKGTYVSKINIKNINAELYIQKAVMEKVFEDTFNSIDGKNILRLDEILLKQKEILKMEDPIKMRLAFYKNDYDFNKEIYKIANLEGVFEIITSNSLNLSRLLVLIENSISEKFEINHQIVEHLKNKNLNGVLEMFFSLLKKEMEKLEDIKMKYKNFFL